MQKTGILLLLITSLLVSGCSAIVVGGSASVAAVAVDKRTAGDMLEDENIELKFLKLFYDNKKINQVSHINFTSYNGWVLLTGETNSEKAKLAIENLATDIKNVKRVFNELRVSGMSSIGSRTADSYLTAKIKVQLLGNDATSGFHTKVVTENGIVYLLGLLSTKQADIVINVVRKISGVERIIKLFDYQ